MELQRKLTKVEKVIIASGDDNYTTYDCSIHGIFQLRKDTDNGKCPYKCSGTISKVDNIKELREKFSQELGFSSPVIVTEQSKEVMKVFKFSCGKHYWAFAAKTKELAIAEFIDQTGEQFTACEEISESEWDKKIISSWADNYFTKKPYKLSIRDVMCGTDPQLIFTSDTSSF